MANPHPSKRGGSRAHQQKAARGRAEQRKDEAVIRRIARKLLDRPLYQAHLAAAFDDGTVHPTIHALIYHYAHGKPKEEVEVKQVVPVRIEHSYAGDKE